MKQITNLLKDNMYTSNRIGMKSLPHAPMLLEFHTISPVILHVFQKSGKAGR